MPRCSHTTLRFALLRAVSAPTRANVFNARSACGLVSPTADCRYWELMMGWAARWGTTRQTAASLRTPARSCFVCKLGFQLCDQLHAAARCELTGLGEHADKRRGVTFTKCGKRCEVLVGFVQQTRGYRRHNMACESFVAQDGVDQRAPGTSVAIREWVNRLELGMSQGALQKRRDVVPLQEQHQIGHACVDQLRLWTHERCAARRV